MIKPARTPQEREILVAYLAHKMGTTPHEIVGGTPYEALAVIHGDMLMGACLFINKRMNSIELAWAGEPGWMTVSTLCDVWAYPFKQLNCLTVTSYIRPDNVKAQSFIERMGGYRCGEVPHAFGLGVPGYLYCMDREKCAWIKPRRARKAAPSIQPEQGAAHV